MPPTMGMQNKSSTPQMSMNATNGYLNQIQIGSKNQSLVPQSMFASMNGAPRGLTVMNAGLETAVNQEMNSS
jgi:hypothetical protein